MLLMLATILMVRMADVWPRAVRSGHGHRLGPQARRGWQRALGSMVLALTLALAAGPAVAEPAPVASTGEQIQRPTPTAGSRTEAQSSQADDYASRELGAKDLEKFEGGSTVVIGGSALVVVLLVILIIVII